MEGIMPLNLNPAGDAIEWTGTVTLTRSSDVFATGTATLTLTPSGGIGNLPALVNGDPGLPPTLRSVTVTQVPYGTTPGPATWTQISPGGAGVASVYDLSYPVVGGQQGIPGTNAAVLAASDVVVPGGGGPYTDQMGLSYWSSDGKLHLQVQPKVMQFTATLGAQSSTGAGQVSLGSIAVPSLPWAWRPVVSGGVYATGTANTRVDLIARLNNATTGDQVGVGRGVKAAGTWPVVLDGSGFGASIAGGSLYGKIQAATAATVYVVAQQSQTTPDAWSTLAEFGTFGVLAVPA